MTRCLALPNSASLIAVECVRKCFYIGLLLAAPIAARPQGIVASRPRLTDRGQVEGLTYSNAALGLRYRLPEGFFVVPLPDNLPAGSLLLMTADKHTGTPWRDRVLLAAADPGKYSWTTSEYATHFVRSIPAKSHVVVRHETYPLKIAGHDFFRVDFQKTEQGKTLYQVFVCTRLKDSLVSWMFTSLNENQVGELATSINTVTFAVVPTKTR
jgi:hypothetical protein